MGKLTIATVREQLGNVGITLRKRDGEFRVNVAGYTENSAYYTNDLEDARDTGLEMATWAAVQAQSLQAFTASISK